MNAYETSPVLEDENFKIRLIKKEDAPDLLEVYSCKQALPFFNSDNCHGSNFYITRLEDMENTVYWWQVARNNREFVRFSIEDKHNDKVIGTVELFNRKAKDYFHNCGLLRIDVHPEYENEEALTQIFNLISEPSFNLVNCSFVASKAPLYAVDRMEALKNAGYVPSGEHLKGHYDNREYWDFWIFNPEAAQLECAD